MYHKRRLGVKEGNAIEDIVAFEMRQKRGEATTADYLAFNKACQHLGINQTATNIVHPAFRGKAESTDEQPVPPMNYIVNASTLSEYWCALKLVGAFFVIWALGCVLLYILMKAVEGLVLFAHP